MAQGEGSAFGSPRSAAADEADFFMRRTDKHLTAGTMRSAVQSEAYDMPATPLPDAVFGWEEDVRYDEIAIGWNEIFDPDVPHAAASSSAPAPAGGAAAPGARRASRAGDASAGPTATLRPRASTTEAGMLWASEVLTSKKPPAYLRIGGGKRSQMDNKMKECLMNYPMNQPRKPAEVMESQLDQLRAVIVSEAKEKRRQARQNRRLQRRCRVRDSDDLESLEAKYLRAGPPGLVARDPADRPLPLSARGPVARAAATKDFFAGLGRRQMAPSSAPLGEVLPPPPPKGSLAAVAIQELGGPSTPATARG